MSAWVWIAVAVVGGLGAIARFLLDAIVAGRVGRALPSGTFVINASGSFALGLLTGLALTGDALIIAGTATIGAFTTFSTWMFETQRLVEDGEIAGALLNVLVSLLVGFGAAALARTIGAHL
ncbi:MAG TPA: fluoride efflux transporter CrcB [Solirubrobacteraceae bacterium]|nr:fluoride efflux transporter CrcB [Solirubrobacteraceae bacterium]